MSYVHDVSAAEFGQAVIQRSNDVPIVVDFWAEWCGPCKQLSPVLEKLAGEYEGAFELVKVDVDANQQLAAQFGVQGIPYVLGFRNGQPVSQFTGALPEPAVREWLDGIMPTAEDRVVDEARDALLEGNEARAEELFREVLATRFDHQEAGTSLAALLISQGRTDEALDMLAPLSPTTEVEKLRAAARLAASQDIDVSVIEARLAADPGDDAARIELAQALAGRSEFEPALDNLLTVVQAKGPHWNEARQAMIDIFEVLGTEHPLTSTYRRRLANYLF